MAAQIRDLTLKRNTREQVIVVDSGVSQMPEAERRLSQFAVNSGLLYRVTKVRVKVTGLPDF